MYAYESELPVANNIDIFNFPSLKLIIKCKKLFKEFIYYHFMLIKYYRIYK